MKLRLLLTALVILIVGGALSFSDLLERSQPQEQKQEETQPGGDNLQATELREGEESQTAKETEKIITNKLSALPKPAQPKATENTKEISTPGPLVSPTPAPPETTLTPTPIPTPTLPLLTSAGIIVQTNIERQQNGVSVLSSNGTLNATALSKASDMCERQYFAHTSPSGLGAGDLAANASYNYLAIGENLARGPFDSDAAVVEAWMNSPGHRANILNSKFTEMGAAAVKCTYQGKNTWMAVQHFGKPVSLCPKPDTVLLQAINAKKATLADMRDQIITLNVEIEATDPFDSNYSSKINSYNILVKKYNTLIAETRALIGQYNNEVSAFNACASS